MDWNEISGRYVPVEDFYTPEIFRQQSEDNKQAAQRVKSKTKKLKHHWDVGMFHT